MKTYGQGHITVTEYVKEVSIGLEQCLGECKASVKEISKLYRKGVSISDAISNLILKS